MVETRECAIVRIVAIVAAASDGQQASVRPSDTGTASRDSCEPDKASTLPSGARSLCSGVPPCSARQSQPLSHHLSASAPKALHQGSRVTPPWRLAPTDVMSPSILDHVTVSSPRVLGAPHVRVSDFATPHSPPFHRRLRLISMWRRFPITDSSLLLRTRAPREVPNTRSNDWSI